MEDSARSLPPAPVIAWVGGSYRRSSSGRRGGPRITRRMVGF